MSLRIDLKPLRGQKNEVFSFDLQTTSLFDSQHGWSLDHQPARFYGEIQPKGFLLELNATIEAHLISKCSRCLAEVKESLTLPVCETLLFQADTNRVEAEHKVGELGEKYWIYDMLDYDFSGLVLDVILDALPITPLCKEDCAGLCPSCGMDLNNGSCNCANEQIDPRWAKLSTLKNHQEV